MSKPLTRLPCRGCLASCKSYAVCEGYPWRINPLAPLTNSDAIKTTQKTEHK